VVASSQHREAAGERQAVSPDSGIGSKVVACAGAGDRYHPAIQEKPMKTRLRHLWFALLLAAFSGWVLAGAREDIEADMQAGRWTQADAKLAHVLLTHPENALAHYWQAQVKWREGQRDAARSQLAEAKRLDPSLRFAGDQAALARLERELAAPDTRASTAPERGTRAAATPMTATRSSSDQPPTSAVPRADPAPASSGSRWPLVAAGIALVLFLVWAARAAKGRRLATERARVRGLLEDASRDLQDANRAIDTRSDLGMAERLALSDRLGLAGADITRHLATLATRSDFAPSQELLRRARDLAAEARGEERPSDVEARRAAQAPGVPDGGALAGGGYAPQVGGRGLGTVGGALGGLAAGAVLGSLMTGSRHAEAQEPGRDGNSAGNAGGYAPIDQFDPMAPADADRPDLGGSGDAGWDSGGDADLGGGGGDDFD
jgi:hypothetical protein